MDTSKIKIVFITAIYGDIETMCKPILQQNMDCYFICFTDKINMISNGWTLDNNPYHLKYNIIDNGSYPNSLNNNNHPRNISKFYKLQFHRIPCLNEYDIVIWLDSSMVIKSDNIAKYADELIKTTSRDIFLFENEMHNGTIESEVILCNKYRDKLHYIKRNEPPQNFMKQYFDYILIHKYNEKYWKNIKNTEHYGLWCCGFIIFNMKSNMIPKLLDEWYLHNLKYTNRDQISFPFVCWKLNIIPYTFPDHYLKGDAHYENTFYKRYDHGTVINHN